MVDDLMTSGTPIGWEMRTDRTGAPSVVFLRVGPHAVEFDVDDFLAIMDEGAALIESWLMPPDPPGEIGGESPPISGPPAA